MAVTARPAKAICRFIASRLIAALIQSISLFLK
jgi:hypothetical protein